MDTCTWVKYKCNLIVIVIVNKKGMFNKPEDIETNIKACLFIYPRIIQGACTYYVLVVDDFHHSACTPILCANVPYIPVCV